MYERRPVKKYSMVDNYRLLGAAGTREQGGPVGEELGSQFVSLVGGDGQDALTILGRHGDTGVHAFIVYQRKQESALANALVSENRVSEDAPVIRAVNRFAIGAEERLKEFPGVSDLLGRHSARAACLSGATFTESTEGKRCWGVFLSQAICGGPPASFG